LIFQICVWDPQDWRSWGSRDPRLRTTVLDYANRNSELCSSRFRHKMKQEGLKFSRFYCQDAAVHSVDLLDSYARPETLVAVRLLSEAKRQNDTYSDGNCRIFNNVALFCNVRIAKNMRLFGILMKICKIMRCL